MIFVRGVTPFRKTNVSCRYLTWLSLHVDLVLNLFFIILYFVDVHKISVCSHIFNVFIIFLLILFYRLRVKLSRLRFFLLINEDFIVFLSLILLILFLFIRILDWCLIVIYKWICICLFMNIIIICNFVHIILINY